MPFVLSMFSASVCFTLHWKISFLATDYIAYSAFCKIGVYYGNPEVTSGGIALKFFASVRLEIRSTGKIKSVSTITT